MSFIDTQEFDIMRGIPAHLKERTDVWEVLGLDGYGVQTLGLGDGESMLMTVAYMHDTDAADVLIESCEALQGSIVDIEDDFEKEYLSYLIKHVDTREAKQPVIYQGNFDAIRVVLKWQVIAM